MAVIHAAWDIAKADGVVATLKRPPNPALLTAVVSVVCVIASWWMFLADTGYGRLIFAICVVFTIVASGIAALCAIRAIRDKAGAQPAGASRNRFPTSTGNLPKKDALVQILLIPGSLTVGFVALAVVDVAVRG